jgi:hypothetical protein
MRRVRGSRSATTGAVAAAVIGIAIAALSACANGAVAEGPMPTPVPTDAAAEVVSVPMPEFAPWPEGDPFSEEQSEAARLANADSQWQGVLATYPNAVRPEVAFEGYVTDANRVDVMRACYEAAGLPIDEGHSGSPDGPVTSIGTSTSNEAEAIAAYACSVAHPTKVVSGPPNDAQLGWIYDYMVEYYAPCFEANGIEVPAPPSRADWVANWPNPGWFPSHEGGFSDPEFDAALSEACVDPDTARLSGLVG